MYTEEINTYRKHKNLKVASEVLGIPLPTLYWRLKKAGEPVMGNKRVHGSDKDKMAAHSESLFKKIVPFAKDNNQKEFQSRIDFTVHNYSVEIKSATLRSGGKGNMRWAFDLRKQEKIADFFICFALNDDWAVNRILFIPGDVIATYQTLSLSAGKSKWNDYVVSEQDIRDFFSLPSIKEM